ncbi:uncharacterized protein isoform X2 [Danio rerio]|uniref:Uncharacterized protein isoform X2 n=1 Tax=Danio rerio TaxID=7955 RepID=A0AC58GXM6_DANRE
MPLHHRKECSSEFPQSDKRTSTVNSDLMTLATCFASQMANNMSAALFTRLNLIKPVFVNDNHQSDTMASPTPPTMMRSPTENPEKGRKGNKASAFFKRAWKAAKRPFLCCDRKRVVPFEPQSDINDFEHLPVPGPSRTVTAHADLEPVWQPGQVCEDPQPLSVPGPSSIKQTADVPNADPACPESSTALTGHVDTELVCLPVQVCDRLESLAVPGPSRIKSTTVADHVDPEQMRPPVQICDDPQPLSVPGPSRIKQTADPARPESSTALTGHVDTELVCLPGQIWEDPQPINVHGLTNIKKMTDADLACPESPPSVQDPSKIDGTDEKPEKRRKRKRVSAFFKRVWKAATRPFLCCDTDIVQHLTPEPEPESKPEPEPESEPKPEPEPEPEPKSAPEYEPKLRPESEPELEYEADVEAVPVEIMPEIAEPTDPESVCLPGPAPEEPKEASGPPRRFDLSHFEVENLIGQGAFGQVFVASHKLRKSEKVALKFINKRKQAHYLKTDGHSTPVLAEVAMMLKLMNAPQCPNIIELYDWVENEKNFILSLEYAESCQTLYEYITDIFEIEENRARRLMHQFIQAVMFCAERGVFHGDIHTENILVTKPRSELKLIDFGCAQPITHKPFNSNQYRGVGFYTPPEVFRRRTFHAYPAYVWTIGLVLYEIMHGRMAFYDRQSIMFGSIRMESRLSTACQDLISQCLVRDPVKRLKLHQVEKHQWFNPTTPDPMELLDKRRKN